MSKKTEELKSVLKKPTSDLIKEKIKKFKKNEKENEDAIELLFNKFKNNSSEKELLLKVIVLNNRYSAGLTDFPISEKRKNELIANKKKLPINVTMMAKYLFDNQEEFNKCNHIESKNKKRKKVISLIDNLKEYDKRSIKEYNDVYSFITKYCYWYFLDIELPIVDRYVKGMLYYYNQCFPFMESFKQADLDNYKSFDNIFNQFKNKYDEEFKKYNLNYTTKDVDMFLWQYAKDLEHTKKEDNKEKKYSIAI